MGAGLGSGFFITFFFFVGLAFFVPFLLRVGALRFAFLDFFATVNVPIDFNQNYANMALRRSTAETAGPSRNRRGPYTILLAFIELSRWRRLHERLDERSRLPGQHQNECLGSSRSQLEANKRCNERTRWDGPERDVEIVFMPILCNCDPNSQTTKTFIGRK
ncbi:MAG: hypothetical protein WA322_09775 [Pseudolabrys sp.]